MTFANIAFKNVRKKFSSYFIFFLSTTFSVFIFHLFCSIYYNPSFESYRLGAGKMSALFRGSAISVFLFSIIFVLYSGSYFIKTHKKETAIYSLLGMKKIQIAVMMFSETVFIGILAIACGVVIGTLAAGYFTSLLMRFMAVGTSVSLVVLPRAILTTIVAFIILFIISGIRAYIIIYKYSLIDLLSASRQCEGIPDYSIAASAVSVGLLLMGYVISLTMNVDVGGRHLLAPVFIGGIAVVAGTFLLFQNFVPMVIAAIKKKKKFYYRTCNFISVSQIAFRLKANARMLSVSALLTAITITMISASYSFYSVLAGDATEAYAPFSYIAKNITEEQHNKILETVSSVGDVHITSENKIQLIHVSMQNDQYAVKDQQTGEAVEGQAVDSYIISESMYLKIISDTNTQKGSYSETRTDFTGGLDDSSCYFIDGNAVSDYCKKMKGQEINVGFANQNAVYHVAGAALHKYLGALDSYKHPTVVVSDHSYEQYEARASEADMDTFYGFQFNDDMLSGRTVDLIDKFIPERFHIGGLPGNMSYIGVYRANFALFGSYVFIGFFLGILFLLASCSVMYYKLIIEAQEEAPRYEILYKTGMNRKEIRYSVAKQLGLVYGLPLIVGLLHTLFGLLFYNRTLGAVGQQTPTLINAFKVVLAFVMVYVVFYILSVESYHSIVWKRASGGNR